VRQGLSAALVDFDGEQRRLWVLVAVIGFKN